MAACFFGVLFFWNVQISIKSDKIDKTAAQWIMYNV